MDRKLEFSEKELTLKRVKFVPARIWQYVNLIKADREHGLETSNHRYFN